MLSLKAPVILGSQSPRRHELLSALGVQFEIMIRPTEETIPEGASPEQAVLAIAQKKADAFEDIKEHYIVITADTIVVLGEKIIGKPTDEAEGVQVLSALSGKCHEVMTAVCIVHGATQISFVERTKVYFRNLSPTEIIFYLKNYEPYDKAGGYGVQDWLGMTAITRIEGDFYNVMGLPVSKVYQHLNAFCV